MAWTALAIAVLVACAYALLFRRESADSPTDDWIVEPVRLGSPRERELYANLRAAFPDNPVLMHVALGKLLRLRRSRGSNRAFLRYFRMCAPYVLCSKDLMPVVVVDVLGTPDAPRVSREREARAALLRASGMLYVAVALDSPVPDANALRELVRAAMKSKSPAHGARTAATAPSPGAVRPTAATPAAQASRAVAPLPAGVPAATMLTTGALQRRTSVAPPFPKPAMSAPPRPKLA